MIIEDIHNIFSVSLFFFFFHKSIINLTYSNNIRDIERMMIKLTIWFAIISYILGYILLKLSIRNEEIYKNKLIDFFQNCNSLICTNLC